jgi:alpha-tubulin suppressor-like RCC1 family protein
MVAHHPPELAMHRSILYPVVLLALGLVGCATAADLTDPTLDARSMIGETANLELIGIDPNRYVEIVAGMHFTCVRRNSGAVFCWGLNNSDQVGRRSKTLCDSGLPCIALPTVVMAGPRDTLRASQIEAGTEHACVIDRKSDAWCWGNGDRGQLGFAFGGTGFPGSPLPVVGGIKFTSIGAGGYSTCGTSPSGMFCWGDFSGGHTVPNQLSTYNGYQSVTVGQIHACALLVVSGNRSVDCWGSNRAGQLGIDLRLLNTTAPFTVSSQFGKGVNGVTTEHETTCVDQESGVVECAGLNSSGQLGNGNFVSTGVPQTVGGGQQLSRVSVGISHTCALDNNNEAWCWGFGDSGQLGNGATGTRAVFATPQAVLGGYKFTAIAVGLRHTCAIGTDNELYCWGINRSGQLGLGLPGGGPWTSPIRVARPEV